MNKLQETIRSQQSTNHDQQSTINKQSPHDFGLATNNNHNAKCNKQQTTENTHDKTKKTNQQTNDTQLAPTSQQQGIVIGRKQQTTDNGQHKKHKQPQTKQIINQQINTQHTTRNRQHSTYRAQP